MGTCCSKDADFRSIGGNVNENSHQSENGDAKVEDDGSIVRLGGSSEYISMAIKQGKKGINQDAMTVWENFTGKEDTFFCGVFDGHGPLGHKMSNFVKEHLPSRLRSKIEPFPDVQIEDVEFFSGLKSIFVESFGEVDEVLGANFQNDSFCSGTTAVTIIKQGERLILGNLGDSRAVLCSRGNKNQLVSIQLTVDLKPNIPSEVERIESCKGRVFTMEEEPGVYRVWMPYDDCPGLAMSRAFGDFCLKDYGLISEPEIFCRKLTTNDEFVVLATDGNFKTPFYQIMFSKHYDQVWDVLSNREVVKTVASVKNRSMAAEVLINRAVRAWRTRYPTSRTDDCAAVILFLKDRPALSSSGRSVSERNRTRNSSSLSEFGFSCRSRSTRSVAEDDGSDVATGVSRANSVARLP